MLLLATFLRDRNMKVFDPDKLISTPLLWWVFGGTILFLAFHIYSVLVK